MSTEARFNTFFILQRRRLDEHFCRDFLMIFFKKDQLLHSNLGNLLRSLVEGLSELEDRMAGMTNRTFLARLQLLNLLLRYGLLI